MSFLPDLAGWALSGGAGSGNGNNNNDNNNNSNEGGAENDDSTNDNQQQQQQETEEEIRAKRISRLAARFGDNEKPDSIPNNGQDQSSMEIGSPTEDHKMVIDENDNKNDIGNTQKQPETISPPSEIEDEEMKPASNNPPSPKKISKSDDTAATKRKRDQLDPTQKLQRKRELLLKKILNINLKGGFVTSPECIQIDLEGASVEDGNIAEILSTRLALPLTLLQSTSPKERNLVSYLAGCHKKASEELKNAKAESLTGNEDFLKEMKNQVVSFAASSLMVPDLFESGKDGINQLTECLTSASLDPAASITMGVSGKNSSFYACLCEELYSQDQSTFESVIQGVSSNISESLSKCETILDSANGSGILQVSALMALCSCKRAAAVLTKITSFLLPPANSPQASEKILVPINLPDPGPNASQQEISIHRMMTAMAQGRQSSYLARSGPALEKKTLLGLIMRIGAPMDNSAINNMFQNVTTRTRNDIKKTTDGLRLQLKSYQDAVYALVKAMITAGEEARKPVCTRR
jgi:ubiquitin conjugation factor E4 B